MRTELEAHNNNKAPHYGQWRKQKPRRILISRPLDLSQKTRLNRSIQWRKVTRGKSIEEEGEKRFLYGIYGFIQCTQATMLVCIELMAVDL